MRAVSAVTSPLAKTWFSLAITPINWSGGRPRPAKRAGSIAMVISSSIRPWTSTLATPSTVTSPRRKSVARSRCSVGVRPWVVTA